MLRNLKPSLLPEGTVIGATAPHYEDLYIKGANGIWEDLGGGCGCCYDSERISDAGCVEDEEYYSIGGMTTTQTSDEYFKDFKVVAVPPEFVFVGDAEALHGEWESQAGMFEDGAKVHRCKGYNCEEEAV
ncbi:hypothetical protein PP914_gp237 [Arthrobacter phage Qui]|jgi:hypothetical protein|uniref:Uncharacterized protein n=1 Tax=Arthrobacter phage Qui TaxID=2603260 RepID=A0A5B8WKV6_9CAUD|nr:hypothetical protein PP914_gp237 [Arthrobacter phage Qui]QED11725.1 hypothetical protein SEA_QUI_237 [Arthrobacter phage Qui]QOC56557.1 hypothetical protein SEA_PAELLA_238 [Arthrobacter phage Paella]